jgi:hypothetical protein
MNDFDKQKYSSSFLWGLYKTATTIKPDGCPDDIELAAFIEGTLSVAQKESIEAHLSVCEDCLDTIIEIGMQEAKEKAAAHEKTKTSWTGWKHLVFDLSFRWLTPAVAVILAIIFAVQFGSLTFKNQNRIQVAVLSSISFGLNLADEKRAGFLPEDNAGGLF